MKHLFMHRTILIILLMMAPVIAVGQNAEINQAERTRDLLVQEKARLEWELNDARTRDYSRLKADNDGLAICHEARRVLSLPYNEARVKKALDDLKQLKNNQEVEKVVNGLSKRLSNYKNATEGLRRTLSVVLEEMKKFTVEEGDRSFLETVAEYCFDKMGETLDKNLLDAQSYPYLYDVLFGAFGAVREHDIDKMEDAIQKLSKK